MATERSLSPAAGQIQPFSYDGVAFELDELARRVQEVFSAPLPEITLRSLRSWFRTQHVYHSNAIEGSTLTLSETQVVIGDGLTVGGKPLRDVLAAKNLAYALDWVEALARTEPSITEQTIREIHALVMRGEDDLLPGHYKTEDNLVSGAQFRTPSFLQTSALMAQLGRFLSEATHLHPAVVSAVAHAWLVGIHPFRDGNGRTARLLANLILLRARWPIAQLHVEQRPVYYQTLDQAHCTGDLNEFVRLWCVCIDATIDEYARLSGALQAREREIDYQVARLNTLPVRSEQATASAKERLMRFVLELTNAAESLNQKLQDGKVLVSSRVEVEGAVISAMVRLSGQVSGRALYRELSNAGQSPTYLLAHNGKHEGVLLENARCVVESEGKKVELTYPEAATQVLKSTLEAVKD